MNEVDLKDFYAETARMIAEWEVSGRDDESSEEQGRSLQKLVCDIARRRASYGRAGKVAVERDRAILDRLRQLELPDPELAVFVNCMRRLPEKPAAAIDYINRNVAQRKAQFSKAQSDRAKNPRRKDIITEIIDELVIKNPEITQKESLNALKLREDILFLDGMIRHKDEHVETPESALKDRLTRAKYRLEKKSRQPG